MQIEIEKVTPEDAIKMLELNPNNRPLNQNRVRKYADQMRSGNWQLNGESIIFAENGRLVDGQHRLNAIVTSGKTIETVVTRGVKKGAFETVDTGTARTAGDLLGINGVTDTNCGVLASMISQDLILSAGYRLDVTGRAALRTPQKVLRAHRKNSDYLKTLEWMIQFPKNTIPMGRRPLGILAYRMFQIDEKFSKSWLEGFLTGAEIPKGDTRLHLLKRFEQDRLNATKLPRLIKMAMVIKAWNQARAGRQISSFHVSMKDFQALRLPTDKRGS